MIRPSTRLRFASAIPRKVKWGVAGCGNFAENFFLPALQLVQRSKLVSVYSQDLKRAKSIANKFGAANAFDDFDALLASGIDAVYISSVNADHYRQVIKAAQAHKNILCERPIALDSKQAGEMVNICNANNVMLIINHMHRFHPQFQKAKELIDKQMLGKIVSVSASYNIDLAPDHNFRFNRELSGGGVLRDLGSQMIDMLRYFGGDITEVKAFMDTVVYKSDVEDFASAIVKFEKSGYGQFNISYNTKKAFNRIEILGYNGSIAIENFLGKKSTSTKLIIDLQGEARKVFRKRSNRMVLMIRSVQKSFLSRQSPFVTGEDDLINMRIIEEIEKQCRYGKS
ncbi:MAG: Gfo/Idh/MocA family oxidoreductase [Bacteroidetes bacterium]|nr:Gfo/Idh/MocA family oxidoreductase [Bacteroidota bacterium]